MTAGFQRKAYPEASEIKRSFLRLYDLAKADSQIGGILPLDSVKEAMNRPEATLYDIVDTVLTSYAGRAALGERAYDIEGTSGQKERRYRSDFSHISYGELQNRSKHIANAWRHHPEHGIERDSFICMVGFSGVDYVSLDLACVYAQTTGVPLQAELGAEHLSDIFENIEPAAIAVSIRDLPALTPLIIKNGQISSLIIMDYDAEVASEITHVEAAKFAIEAARCGTKLITLGALIAYGAKHKFEPYGPHPRGAERRVSIVHSSGSTGVPKGAVLPERAVKMIWRGANSHTPVVTITPAPFNHVIGRNAVMSTLSRGGLINFTLMPDMSSLFEDIRLTRPTNMAFFPRILELIYQNFQNEVTRRKRTSSEVQDRIEAEVKAEMGASFLGDRLLSGGVGGAPVSDAVMTFMRECFDMLMLNIYGSTESGSGTITRNGKILRPPVTEYRLRDAPELGYYTTDKPNPRGELCFKSTGGITEYYKQPNATKGLFDADGFQCTGDIVEEIAPDHVIIIDRRKDVLKLSQGEFVAVGPLGTVFEGGSAVLKQVYLYGNSLRSYLLAVVVPDAKAAESLLGEAYDEAALRDLIHEEFRRVGLAENLKSFEIPREFIIEREAFSQENGLLSSVRKRLRPALKRKYGAQLEAIYAAAEARQKEDIAQLKDAASTLTTAEKIGKVLAAQLGLQSADIDSERSFTEWGGDSLGAVLFGLSLEDVFGVEVPPNIILSPAGSIEVWAKYIDQALAGGAAQRPSFASIHGKDAAHITAQDLRLAHFIDGETLETSQSLTYAPPKNKAGLTILITGANGFLGRFVCLDWLEKIKASGGKVICLIRGKTNAKAAARLRESFQDGGELEAEFTALAQDHLEVIAGDLADARFGLSEDNYNDLAQSVDRIVHVAALVNHKLSYASLFDANVLGTAELIGLALKTQLKAIDFVSTVAVQPNLDMRQGNTEAAPLKPRIALTQHYASGYGASKWAGEIMLGEAREAYGIPVNIFRGDMMLTHETYAGQMNSEDMFTRLLYSLIETGIAPKSFYQLNKNGDVQPAHYDGLPVNIVARTVSESPIPSADHPSVFNILNYHAGDGISLDAFTQWCRAAGHKIHSIDSHQDWFATFTEKLNALPPEKRSLSVLTIAEAFSRPLPPDRALPGHENFRALYASISGGADIPHLSERYIRKCLSDMKLKGLTA